MLNRKIDILFTISLLLFTALACNMLLPQAESAPAPTQIVEPASTQPQANLPESEAAVPRVTVEETKAALDSGAAIIVDLRSAGDYEAGHIPGAINIQIGEFETNPTDLKLDKGQWIITYCA